MDGFSLKTGNCHLSDGCLMRHGAYATDARGLRTWLVSGSLPSKPCNARRMAELSGHGVGILTLRTLDLAPKYPPLSVLSCSLQFSALPWITNQETGKCITRPGMHWKLHGIQTPSCHTTAMLPQLCCLKGTCRIPGLPQLGLGVKLQTNRQLHWALIV